MAMRVFLPALLALFAPAAAAAAQQPDIVVNGEVARVEIERILEADNLDADRLSPREVVEIMAGIERGRAPEDFWEAYQMHLRAWRQFADVVDAILAQQGESAFAEREEELAQAEQAVDATFGVVEALARRYGARLPVPPGERLPTI